MGARPQPLDEGTRRRLQQQRRADTRPEVLLRRALHRRGLRYRLHRPVIPGARRTVDIVFPSARVAVDVRGCFWHGCPAHGTAPRSNATWWQEKLSANRRRDADTAERLEGAGWVLVVVWEHDDPEAAAAAIAELVRRRRAAGLAS